MEKPEKLELIREGCLGTCWYGHYHYIEPWVGCEFNCTYCYAKYRQPVNDKLKEINSIFENPALFFSVDELIKQLGKEAETGRIKRAKLSRYTDIFCPSMKNAGVSYRVLQTLAQSPVERIIITTKGFPDRDSAELMKNNRDKFSLNMIVKPETPVGFRKNMPETVEKIEWLAHLNKSGVLCTVHLDPLIPPYENNPELLEPLFSELRDLGLQRLMFSYLLLNDSIIECFRNEFGGEITDSIVAMYEEDPSEVLPNQEETRYYAYKEEYRRENIKTVAGLLRQMGFDYVLCSLKSGKGKLHMGNTCNLCDGKFYA